jgi:hypothetical protein
MANRAAANNARVDSIAVNTADLISGGRALLLVKHADGVLVTVSANPGADALRRWDRMVAATPGADVAQLSSWATVRRHARFLPVFVLAEDATGLIGGALVLPF